MNKKLKYLLLACFVVLGNSCANNKDYLVTIQTKFGDMKVILFDKTPKHKNNFIKLAESGRYDSTVFHRVIKGFMVQGGDIDAKEKNSPSKETVPAEFVPEYYHKKGALAAARQSDQVNPEKASSWCQFYIVHGDKFSKEELTVDQNKFSAKFRQYCDLEKNAALREEILNLYNTGDMKAYQKKVFSLVPEIEAEFNVVLSKSYPAERLQDYSSIGGAPHLDDQYTVFGMVVDGLEVVDSIAVQPTSLGDKPVEDVVMKVTVEEVNKKKITKEYGYQYPEN
ncbi:peptidylprolyl isomerase [Fulvivirgaceae bacterium BMA12]|uniref:Peptidyl-prolyl cis-trans isomerase n=1 Tax=Agaribacillus aureus TaxID=3051825 RepID=A0ABT8L3W4_9BACT|nr:peptidylprolyl isomerase [Fulvivirgaceae bacterium BMA12]